MKDRFEDYYNEDYTEYSLDENAMIFGENTNSYQEGFGHGFYYGSIYNNEYGCGRGKGYDDGLGGCSYPVQLIQYWKN